VTVVGIVGAGTMGAGIAQVVVEAGDEAILHDVDPLAAERARERVRDGLVRGALRLDLDADSADAWVDGRLERLRHAETLDALGAEAGIVIEAVIEDLELKQTIFRVLDQAAPDAILATNTSALSVAAIAAATARPARVLGLHWFNPVPRMGLVEVVATDLTDPAVVERAEVLIRGWGKTPVRCADTPGFIVNRVNRPFTIEALRILEAGDAGVEAIDAALRDDGFPMGPFELMDLAGLDVNLAAATAVWEGLGRPGHLAPSPIQARLVDEGHLGRKTGEGFYRYVDGVRGPVAPGFADADPAARDPAAIAARITDAVAREARAAAATGVAAPDDIALALRLGAAHPRNLVG
jgi:3-hydroxybutyryl-CoA dehydrogenase